VITLPGSLADLVDRAGPRPISCIAPNALHPVLINAVVSSFRRDFPCAEFVTTNSLYRDRADWSHYWPREAEQYGAAIIVTRGEDRPERVDPFTGLSGEHVIGIRTELEIKDLVRLGRPVGWHAVVFPATYWFAGFTVEPFTQEIQSFRYARLVPAADAEPFHPVMLPCPWLHVVRRDGP
jgi:hypothetical protein